MATGPSTSSIRAEEIMKILQFAVVVLAVSAVRAAPSPRLSKRDILPGDPRFGTDYHLHHHHAHSSGDLNAYLPPSSGGAPVGQSSGQFVDSVSVQNSVESQQSFELPSTSYGVPFQSTPAPEASSEVRNNQYLAPVASSGAHTAHSAPVTVHHTPAPVVHHAPAPAAHYVPAPAVHHAPVVHHAPAPVAHYVPAPAVHHTPVVHHAPVVHSAPSFAHSAPVPFTTYHVPQQGVHHVQQPVQHHAEPVHHQVHHQVPHEAQHVEHHVPAQQQLVHLVQPVHQLHQSAPVFNGGYHYPPAVHHAEHPAPHHVIQPTQQVFHHVEPTPQVFHQPTQVYGPSLQHSPVVHHVEQPVQQFHHVAPTPVTHPVDVHNVPSIDNLVFDAPVQSIEVSQSHSVESVAAPAQTPSFVNNQVVNVEPVAKETGYSQPTGSNGGYVY